VLHGQFDDIFNKRFIANLSENVTMKNFKIGQIFDEVMTKTWWLMAVFHLDPQGPGGNRNVQGGRSMGAIEEMGFGEGLCPSPTGGSGGCAPRKKF